MPQLNPIVNAGELYCNELVTNWASNTSLTITAGASRDHNNVIDLIVNTPTTTLNATVNGLNGLDQGALAASTWYYVYIIGSSTNKKPTGFLLSASQTAPFLPAGYDSYRLINHQLTNGSGNFLLGWDYGRAQTREKYWNSVIQVVTSGSAATLTPVNLLIAVPPFNNLPVNLTCFFTATTPATDNLAFANFGAISGLRPTVSAGWGNLQVLSGLNSSLSPPAPEIQYIVTVDTDVAEVYVSGYRYTV
jgi:hypothetical protein